jgi:threonine/homoserine/homoserine lactone efflux protein
LLALDRHVPAMTVAALAALFGAMVVLAATPSSSVLLVTTRSVASGFSHGASTAAGVVVGDLVFILVAVFGLSLLVEAVGDAWFLFKYVAAAYLLWLGVRLWHSAGQARAPSQPQSTSLWSSFTAGLFLTLADQKAVLFYLAFLPAFLDLADLSWLDLAALVTITIVAVGGIKLAYAYAATRATALVTSSIGSKVRMLAAVALLATAVAVVVRG